MGIDYNEVLAWLINEFGWCNIVDASFNPKKYGLKLCEVMEIATQIYCKHLETKLKNDTRKLAEM